MFYSVDLLRIRGSKKGRLPKCWIAATIKEFVGREKTKIDKQEIIKFDIEAACEDILDRVNTGNEKDRFSLYLSSQLTFGVIRIFQKKVDFLLDDCEKLISSVDPTKKKSKSKKKDQIDLTDEGDLPLAIDVQRLFPKQKVDKHQIQELFNTNLPVEIRFEFDDPVEADDEIRSRNQWDSPIGVDQALQELNEMVQNGGPQARINEAQVQPNMQENVPHKLIAEEPSNAPGRAPPLPDMQENAPTEPPFEQVHNASPEAQFQEPREATEAHPEEIQDFSYGLESGMVPPVTPSKRKSRGPHNETPTKRKRIPGNERQIEGLSTPSSTRFRGPENLSEAARSPIILGRRLNFDVDNEPGNDAAVPLEYPDMEVGAAALRAQENIHDKNASNDNNYSAPPNFENDISESILDRTRSIPPADPKNPAQPMDIDEPHEPPTDEQPANKEITAASGDDELIELPPVDESQSTPLQRSTQRRRTRIWSDENKQIAIIFPTPSVKLYTRSMKSTLAKLDQRISSKTLLKRLTRLLISKKLLQFFEELIEEPRFAENDPDLGAATMRVDRFVNILPRRSRISRQNITAERTTGSQNTDHQLPHEENQMDAQQDLHQEVTQNRDSMPNLPDDPSVAQELIPNLAVDQSVPQETRQFPEFNPQENVEMENNADMPVLQPESTNQETDDTFLPRRYHRKAPNSEMIEESEPQLRRLEDNYIVSREEFYEFLLKMWEIVSSYSMDDEDLVKIELDDILNADNSIQEVYYYVIYLFELQKNHKLHLKQEYPFGPIHIINRWKLVENSEIHDS